MIFTDDVNIKGYKNITEVLFTENYDKVYKIAVSILSDVELAKDAAQETFYRAFLKIDTLADKGKFSPWVGSIAVNVCNRMLKQKIKDRNKNVSIYDNEGNIRSSISELIDFEVPDNIYENAEMRKELKQCIHELDIELQQIINMRFYLEFSIEKIAECLNMKEGTVKSKIFRAKQKVAEKYFKLVKQKGLD